MSDDPGRRQRVATGGYTSTAVLAALIGLATAPWQVALLRVAAWFARGIRVPARNALLADLVPSPAVYGRAYGFERAMDNFGAIVGPLLALGLVGTVGVRTAMLVSVVPGLLAAGAIVLAIRAAPRLTARERRPIQLQIRPSWGLLGRLLGRLMVGVTAFELGHAAATLLILRGTQLLEPIVGQQAATEQALGLYVVFNVAATLASFPAGRLGDRAGAVLILWAGVLCFLLAYVGFAIGPTDLVRSACVLQAQVWLSGVWRPRSTRRSLPCRLRNSEARPLVCWRVFRASVTWPRARSRACCGHGGPGIAFGYLAVCAAVALGSVAYAARPDR